MQDLTGKKFGKLTVIGFSHKKRAGKTTVGYYWYCVCECGVLKTIEGRSLRKGKTKSCGCISKKVTSSRSKTHGLSRTKIYQAWMSMKGKCNNPKHMLYRSNGAVGIGYDPKWETFEGFFEDMGEGYTEGAALRRVDKSMADFSKETCKWIMPTTY